MNRKKSLSRLFIALIMLVTLTLAVPQSVFAARVSISKTSLSSSVGTVHILYLKGVPRSDIRNVRWKTSNSSVVALQNTASKLPGKLQFIGSSLYPYQEIRVVGKGTARVTATYRGKTYTCKVTGVAPKATVRVGRSTATLKYGVYTSINLRTKGTKTAQVKVSNASNSVISYANSNSSVVSVSTRGKITARRVGNAIILVRVVDKTTSKITSVFAIKVKVS